MGLIHSTHKKQKQQRTNTTTKKCRVKHNIDKKESQTETTERKKDEKAWKVKIVLEEKKIQKI